MKNLMYTATLAVVLAGSSVHAHELGTVPCSVSSMSNLLMFGFNTFQTTDEGLLSLKDGKVSIGISMEVEGSELSFSKNFSPVYNKSGANIVGESIWSTQEISEEAMAKIGSFPNVTCVVTGYGEK